MKIKALSHFSIRIPVSVRGKEILGSLFDLWFLLPLVGLMVVSERGGSAAMMGRDLIFLGGAWLLSALLYRTPLPLQPLKVWAFLFLILRPTPLTASLSAVLLGGLLLLTSASGLTQALDRRLSECSIARIRRGVGVYVRAVALLAMGMVILRSVHGLLPAPFGSWIPGAGEHSFSVGLSVLLLVLPQFPVTLVNGVLATVREQKKAGRKGDSPDSLTGESLSGWVGLASLSAGLLGTLPFCHGSGNLWAYRRFGVQTILPSVVSSVLLIGLGSGLLWHPVPMPSVFLLGAFLGGFFLAERYFRGATLTPDPKIQDDSEETLIDWIVLSGGMISGVLIIGGIPLLLVLLLGIQTATTVRGPFMHPGNRVALKTHALSPSLTGGGTSALDGTKKGALSVLPDKWDTPLMLDEATDGSPPKGSPSIHDPRDAGLFPERYFRRAREVPSGLLTLILLVLFCGSALSGSLPRTSFLCPLLQSSETLLQPPARAP